MRTKRGGCVCLNDQGIQEVAAVLLSAAMEKIRETATISHTTVRPSASRGNVLFDETRQASAEQGHPAHTHVDSAAAMTI